MARAPRKNEKPRLIRELLKKYPPGKERDILMLYLNGASLSQIVKALEWTVRKPYVRWLTEPYKTLRRWKDAEPRREVLDQIGRAILDDELDRLG